MLTVFFKSEDQNLSCCTSDHTSDKMTPKKKPCLKFVTPPTSNRRTVVVFSRIAHDGLLEILCQRYIYEMISKFQSQRYIQLDDRFREILLWQADHLWKSHHLRPSRVIEKKCCWLLSLNRLLISHYYFTKKQPLKRRNSMEQEKFPKAKWIGWSERFVIPQYLR
jgi:hypothetical protein